MYPLFGYGLETLDIVFTEWFCEDIIATYGSMWIVDKAHNEYLHIAVSTGIPSLVLY
jgi:putative inorganic carbon (HCO3(-)) transporter